MANLYNEKINEFVDWVNGTNYLTGGNVTGGRPVSGGKIRELLQERLRTPIEVFKDKTEKLYRIFSSVESRQLWESDRNNMPNQNQLILQRHQNILQKCQYQEEL